MKKTQETEALPGISQCASGEGGRVSVVGVNQCIHRKRRKVEKLQQRVGENSGLIESYLSSYAISVVGGVRAVYCLQNTVRRRPYVKGRRSYTQGIKEGGEGEKYPSATFKN